MGFLPSVADLEMLHSMQTAGCRAAVVVAAEAAVPSERHSAVHLTLWNMLERHTLPSQRVNPVSSITLPHFPRKNMCITSWLHIEGPLLHHQPVASVPLPHPMVSGRLRDTGAKRTDLNTWSTGRPTYQATTHVGMAYRTGSGHMRIQAIHKIALITAGCPKARRIVRTSQVAAIIMVG